jgi:hypothetical protein
MIGAFFIPQSSTNPVGFVISAISKQCASGSLANYRAMWCKGAELDVARAILDEPANWDHDSMAWAERITGGADQQGEGR